MAISLVGSVAASATTATIPAHQAGDLLVAFAFNSTAATAPSLPSGWTNGANGAANTCGGRVATRIATGSGTASGTWTNANRLIILVYRSDAGNLSVGQVAGGNGTGTAVTLTALGSLQAAGRTSKVASFAGHRTATTFTDPAGLTRRQVTATAPFVAAWDSANPATYAAKTTTADVSSGWRGSSVEIIETIPVPIPTRIKSWTMANTDDDYTVVKPAGAAAGDVLYVIMSADDAATDSISGAAFVDVLGGDYKSSGSNHLRIWRRVLDGTEPATFTTATVAGASTAHQAILVTGVDTNAPEFDVQKATGDTNKTATAPTASGVASGLLLSIYSWRIGDGGIYPTTVAPSQALVQDTGRGWINNVVGAEDLGSTGATGTRAAVLSTYTPESWLGVNLVLQAPVAAVPSTGAGSLTAAKSTVAGSGTVRAQGTGALAAGKAAIAGSGTVGVQGTGGLTATPAALAGSGTLGPAPVSGAGGLAATKSTIAGSGSLKATGAGGLSATKATATGTGTVKALGSGALAASPAEVAASGKVINPRASVWTGSMWKPIKLEKWDGSAWVEAHVEVL